MNQEPPTPQDLFVDCLALVYHEARNVRHLIKAKHLPSTGWEQLRSLPTNRNEAWAHIQSCRRQARQARSASEAAQVFARQFGVGLTGLLDMYENPNWHHAKGYGGNAWAQITRDVIALRKALDGNGSAEFQALVIRLSECRHNNGKLTDKLRALDQQ